MAKAGEATRQAIIDTAEKMFSDQGITAVSLRSILAEAGANTAAAHYHFGSKENLIAEVFARRAKRVADERMDRLGEVLKRDDDATLLEEIIRAFIEPGFFGGADTREAGEQFARLRARLTTDDSELAGRLLSDVFDESSHRYMKALSDALPDLSKIDVQWRFHALLGVMVYTVTGPGRIQSLTDNACDPSDLHTAVEHLVPTLAGMFRAPPTLFTT
jgi:AcrR family transcriptional regulator